MNTTSMNADSRTNSSTNEEESRTEGKEFQAASQVKQEEVKTNSSPQQPFQPYTAHSFILPSSITSTTSNSFTTTTSAPPGSNGGLPTLGPGPAPLATGSQPQQQPAPITIGPFHGMISHHHHPIMVAATGTQSNAAHALQQQAGGAAPTTIVPGFMLGTTPVSFLIAHAAVETSTTSPIVAAAASHYSGKMRSGKWLPEEEAYALLLVQLFEQGLLPLQEGATLRAFLAKRLHCPPMRVSKKFAGRGIGKMVYSPAVQHPSYTMEQQQFIAQKLQQTEDKFHRAIFPFTAPRYTLPCNMTAVNSSAGGKTNALQPTMVLAPNNKASQSTMPAPFAMPTQVLSSPRKQQPTPASVVSNPPQQHTAAAFFTQQQAFQQQPINNPLHTILPPAKAPSTTTSTSIIDSYNATAKSATNSMQPPESTTSSAAALAVTDTHDLLSGFDKVVQQNQLKYPTTTTSTSITDLEEAHSPPFTSQSFDDFHRFLGKDLTLLESSTTEEEQPKTTSSIAPHFVQESYRMLRMDEPPPLAFRPTSTSITKDTREAFHETDAVDDVLDASVVEPSLAVMLQHSATTADRYYRHTGDAGAALVSEDGTNSSDSDASEEPVRKKIKTAA